MTRSMTGFGRAAVELEAAGLEVEIRCVNHRHLDVRVRLPRAFAALEASVVGRVRECLARGRVEVGISFAGQRPPTPEVHVDLELAGRYFESVEALAARHDLPSGLDAAGLLGLPGVATPIELRRDEDSVQAPLLRGVDGALEGVVAMREAEGQALARELFLRLDRVEKLAVRFEERSGEVLEAVREKWKRRAEEFETGALPLEPARLHQEIVLASDRLDITEELARLRSHVVQFREFLAAESAVGRKLDFLLQEMAREANTVGSKASDAPMASDVVELKTELERMREQVQNIE
jgi:uncharacterized protein (TIGR00255 family)